VIWKMKKISILANTYLAPCPFCGEVAHSLHNGMDLWSVYCLCGAQIEQSGGGYFTKQEAIAAWNNRVEIIR